MKRGEIWTVSGGTGYASKPRPVIVLQDERFDSTDSLTVCGCTTEPADLPLFRLRLEPDDRNGLRVPCSIMVDKITSVRRSKVGRRIGRLSDEDIVRLNRAIIVFLGLAAGSRGTA